jgi:RNA recognition motif-containing protein
MNIYITNVDHAIECADLLGLFREFGKINWTRIVRTAAGSRYGLVEMPDEAAARKAVDRLDGMYWRDSLISVSLSCLQVVRRNQAENFYFSSNTVEYDN